MASNPDSSSPLLATTATASEQTQETPQELPPTSQDSHPSPPPSHSESPTPPCSHPESSTPPPSHLPSFITALSLKPRHLESVAVESGSNGAKKGSPGGLNTEQACSDEKMDTTFHQDTLTEKFKQDPDYVLSLLRSVVSVDKLTSLLQAEYHGDKKQLELLQTKLEEAYMTVSECGEKKEALTAHIEETNDRIRTKRKHLERLREELKELGEEETQLKRRRDTSYAKCSELKKKLKASREALQQISVLGRSSKQTTETFDNKKAAS